MLNEISGNDLFFQVVTRMGTPPRRNERRRTTKGPPQK